VLSSHTLSRTHTHLLPNTHHYSYLSPELLNGDTSRLDKADVFALGATLVRPAAAADDDDIVLAFCPRVQRAHEKRQQH
jgi:hypothetical protein